MLTSQMTDVFFNFTVSSRVSREHNGSRDVLTSVSNANGYNLYSNTMADGTAGPKSRRGLSDYFRFDLCRLVFKIRPSNELIYFLCLHFFVQPDTMFAK